MTRNWIGVRVELLGGTGRECWPPPGRVLAVGPRHSFGDLAAAIDTAFARWDRAHLCEFTLADGTVVTDEETAQEDVDDGTCGARLLLERERVVTTVRPGDEFRYVFDFGARWTHRCTVEEEIDPLEVLGIVPAEPLPYGGWGDIPDQHGRRWDDDTGEGPVPTQPARPEPMLDLAWLSSATRVLGPVDAAQVRGATYRGDAEVGTDDVVDVESEPDRWLPLERLGSRDGWRDMAVFAARQRDDGLRRRLESSIEGRDAFRRFRDLVGEAGIVDAWRRFADDRALGRARVYLAAHGVRVLPGTVQRGSGLT